MTPRETTIVQAPLDDESCATSSVVSSCSDYEDDSDVQAAARPLDPTSCASCSSHHQQCDRRTSPCSPTTVVCSSSLLLSVQPPALLPHHRPLPLGLVFDLDGTLVAEPLHDDDHGVYHSDATFLRPGVREFLRWCRHRGHVVAVWTAAQSAWAHYVSWKLTATCGNTASSSSSDCNDDDAPNFAFVWDATKLRRRRRIPVDAHGLEPSSSSVSSDEGGSAASSSCCCWCGPYRHVCDRCTCATYGVYTCPCRSTKDLRKVWRSADLRSRGFVPHRTLLIENTPQQCLNNYGNAVYVPTYRGNNPSAAAATTTLSTTRGAGQQPDDKNECYGVDNDVLIKLQALILQLENAPDVRHASKCHCPTTHHHQRRPHACHEQCWWTPTTTTTTTTTLTGGPTASVATTSSAPMDSVRP